jgi:tRNA-Thr(GGU) m(6)t(6)A37 methyltransferase TsaA
MTPIGTIHTPFKTKQACPIQPLYAAQAQGHIEVFAEYAEGLRDIESFSHIHLFYLFDRAESISLVRSTFLDDTPHGIYASRHPCRPNSLGMSIVRLVRREDNILIVEGVDILDQTPLIDIKPYLPQYDCIPSASQGWTAGKAWRPKPDGRE